MSKCIFRLDHRHKVERDPAGTWIYSTCAIGYYTSRKRAKRIIEQYRSLPGFSDYPNGFRITKVRLNYDNYDFMEEYGDASI